MRTKQQVQDRSSRAARVEPLEARTLMSVDMVLEWNQVAVEATRVAALGPPPQTRALAMVQGAVFDAVNGIERDYAPYLVSQHAPSWASAEAAAAAAAHGVLVGLLPAQQTTLDAALTSSLATVRDGRAENAGVAYGRAVAQRMLADRQDDGSRDVVTYVPGTGPDDWRPTPPGFAAAAVPQWATLEPFGIRSPDQFRADPPPAIDSAEFTAAFNEVKAIGASNSTTRTAEQTEIALYWAGPSGTIQPPGHWNSIARNAAVEECNSMAENARMLALLNFGMADAMITGWDTKFHYNFVRPATAIPNANNDPNPDTVGDSGWTTLIGTPAHPSYTSTHSTVSASAAAVLANVFGTDAIRFMSTTEIAPGGRRITRSFRGFRQAAEEAAASRLYGGIHWSFDNRAGLEAGRDVGRFVSDRLLRPLRGRDGGGDDKGHGAAEPCRCPDRVVTRMVTGLPSGLGSTVGPDGNLYLAEGKTGKVLRVNPRTGTVSTFAEGLPPWVDGVGEGGAMDIEFVGGKAYVLVTGVGPDLGGDDTVGIYRVDGPDRFTVVADIGAYSLANPPEPAFFVPTGWQYALESYRGDLLVADAHHNRVLRVDLDDGDIDEVMTFGNIVPTGMAIEGNTVYLAQAGAIPHRPADGKVVSFRVGDRRARLVASGAPLLVDVEFGRGNTMYALAQGPHNGVGEGTPALPNTGTLVKANRDGTFTVIADKLDRPTSMEIIGDAAYIVMLDGEVWRVDNLSGSRRGHGAGRDEQSRDHDDNDRDREEGFSNAFFDDGGDSRRDAGHRALIA